MESTAKRIKGLGRTCHECNLAMAQQEDGVEVDGKVYHAKHNPLRVRRPPVQLGLFARVGRQYAREVIQ